jgi:hypothetical protein
LRDGDVWTLTFDDLTIRMPDSKGLRDLQTLVRHPGKDITAVELLNPHGGDVVVSAHRMGSDPLLDGRALAEFRSRVSTIDEAIDRALATGDDVRAQRLDTERAALLEEIRTATGLGGRPRRLGDDGERARKAVTARIRDTLRRLEDRHPALARHLSDALTTGASCRYDPPEPVTWET